MSTKRSFLVLLAAVLLSSGSAQSQEIPFKEARIYIEYNQTADDLGYHVALDAEDWKRLKIVNPDDVKIFEVIGFAAYRQLGMTELFFEGAEPNLADFPLADLLALFPEGEYEFEGLTVDNQELESTAVLSHAIPNGPGNVTATLSGNSLVIRWSGVTTTPPGFPVRPISIAGYQVILKPFQVTVPANVRAVTVPPQFVAALPAGVNAFEVLAIDASGNQSITESSFVKP
jgi:hypothetical protein